MTTTTVLGENVSSAIATALLVASTALCGVAVSLFVRALDQRSAGPTTTETVASLQPGTSAAEAPAVAASGSPPLASEAAAPPAFASGAAHGDAVAAPSQTCGQLHIAFHAGQVAPSAAIAARLRELAAELKAHPEITLVIDGHADSLGSDELNLRLSKRRADTLAWLLSQGGVERQRITARGFGAFSPVEGTTEQADINRRAIIHQRGGCIPGFKEVLGP